MDKVNHWLETEGNRFIHIYGALDTWTASAVPPSDSVDAVWFVMNGKSHGTARIKNMTQNEKIKLVSTLERWLEADLDMAQ